MSPSPFKIAKAIPRRTLRLAAVLVLVLMLGVFALGRYSVELEASSALLAKRELQSELSELRAKHDALFRRHAIIESARKVDQASVMETNAELTDLQAELGVVKQQLAFYQRIVSPENLVKGLYIEGFELSGLADTGGFAYQLTLAQLQRKQPFVKGSVDLLWVDKDGGQHSFFSGAEPKQKRPTFGFRYFQLLQGELRLPDGASPVAIEVRVNPSSKGRKSVKTTRPWAEVIKQ